MQLANFFFSLAEDYVKELEFMESAYCAECGAELSGKKFKLTNPEHLDEEGSWITAVVDCDECEAKNHYRIIRRSATLTSIIKEWPAHS